MRRPWLFKQSRHIPRKMKGGHDPDDVLVEYDRLVTRFSIIMLVVLLILVSAIVWLLIIKQSKHNTPRMDIADLCIHKDITKTREYILHKFHQGYDERQPITYCSACTGRKDDCFYYHSLGQIKQGSETNKQEYTYISFFGYITPTQGMGQYPASFRLTLRAGLRAMGETPCSMMQALATGFDEIRPVSLSQEITTGKLSQSKTLDYSPSGVT